MVELSARYAISTNGTVSDILELGIGYFESHVKSMTR
jgi:hypothetical protein